MLLKELKDYKNELMKTLCCNPEIVRLITDSKQAAVPNLNLRYTQIYPFEYIPETVNEGMTFICFDVDIVEVPNKTFYAPALYIWAFTHKSKMCLAEGGIRTDRLAEEIDKELNGNRNFGLGELKLHSVSRFSPIVDYQGRVLTYYAVDFNRPGYSKRPPANRKNYD
jgi:hypothetical protein